MIEITNEDLLKISEYAQEYLILWEYYDTHLSYQLAETSKVVNNGDSVSLLIEAPTYDISKFKKEGVIVHDNRGSYANANDLYGGFSKEHKGFIERCIKYALKWWLKDKGIDESEVEVRWN